MKIMRNLTFILVLLLASCSAPPKQTVPASIMPPAPKLRAAASASVAIVPAKPRTLVLRWQCPAQAGVVHEVRSTTNASVPMKLWPVKLVTPSNAAVIWPTNALELFTVNSLNTNTGLRSR